MVEHQQTPDQDSQPDVQYERRDVTYRGLAMFMVGLGVFVVLAAMFLVWLFEFFAQRNQPLAGERVMPLEQRTLPDLRPNANQEQELTELRRREQRLLYGPPSRVGGHEDVVRIPVDRAMQLILEQGLPGGEPSGRSASSSSGSEGAAGQDATTRSENGSAGEQTVESNTGQAPATTEEQPRE